MSGITVPMAIIDFVTVAMFFIAAVVLQRDLYSKLVKGAFALMASGSILILCRPAKRGQYRPNGSFFRSLGCIFRPDRYENRVYG